VLDEGYRLPGEYSVKWDGINERGTRVDSGVYFYRLLQNDASMVKKVVIVK
jgi:hypothetical protein